MKKNILFFAVIIMAVFQFNFVFSQEGKGKHTFKIVGSAERLSARGKETVEYDPNSPDHLFIVDYDPKGIIISIEQYLVDCNRFDLSNGLKFYIDKRELIADGISTIYGKKGVVYKTVIHKDGKPLQQNLFYPDGQKQSLIPGIEILEGEYKMWNQNGQLSFSGNYKNNQKNGDFEQFDQAGIRIKKGTYQEGKLVSGESVVPDIIYYEPEVAAKYGLGESAFDEYLTKRAMELGAMNVIMGERKIFVDIGMDKTGKILKLQNISGSNRAETESIKSIFSDCPDFLPATIENVPVQSFQRISLLFSKEGIKMRSEEMVYTNVDEMPEFPGGPNALIHFISANLKYPLQPILSRIEGRVFVGFVVGKEGDIKDVRIIRKVNPFLDDEAIRVVSLIPKFIPGRLQGKTVNVQFVVPINFQLTN